MITRAMSDVEKNRLEDKIRAMSPDQLEVVASCIPFDICLLRIQREFDRNAEIVRQIQSISQEANR